MPLMKWIKNCRSKKMSHRDMVAALKQQTDLDVSKSSIYDWCRMNEVD